MNNKHIVLEDMIEFTKPVITAINLVTKTNFKRNKWNKVMFKSTLNSLESYLKVNDSNKKCVKQAIERKTGARALRSIVESVIADAKYDCPGTNIAKVEVKDDLSLQYIEH